jgi:hypothetical protein
LDQAADELHDFMVRLSIERTSSDRRGTATQWWYVVAQYPPSGMGIGCRLPYARDLPFRRQRHSGQTCIGPSVYPLELDKSSVFIRDRGFAVSAITAVVNPDPQDVRTKPAELIHERTKPEYREQPRGHEQE